jgi:oligoendopeptidase F
MDITDPDFWDAGLRILEGMVTEVERLAGAQTRRGDA